MGHSESSFFDRHCARLAARPPLGEEEERALARRWIHHGDRKAADALVEAHLPLVLHLARRLRGYGVPRDELVGEGSLGLLRAVEKFDLRGVRFKTYATYWIRAYMLSYILRGGRIVTQATGALGARLFFKLRGARAKAEALLGPGHDGIDAHLAAQFGVTEDVIRRHTALLSGHDQSLDTPVGEDGDATVLDLTPGDGATPEERALAQQRDEHVNATVRRVWKALDERERAVLEHRLMADDGALTLEDLGARFKLSRERLRQIELRLKQRLGRALGEHAALGDAARPSVH